MNKVRVRIAPSPTGFPHIGTIYQALFNFAYAKKFGGTFIVRIEDTDRKRFINGAEEKIYEALDWFGLSEDESPRKSGKFGPYRQSERLEIYQKYIDVLVQSGHAYYCFCTEKRLEEVRNKLVREKKMTMYDQHCRNLDVETVKNNLDKKIPKVIRLKVPLNSKIIIKDEIRGEIEFDSNLIDDQVLQKSDGFPTYHLGVVVDDHLMEITHIVRGEEWLASTPKHYLLYDFFGWQKPLFFHTPVLRNPDKSKLSKRHAHTNFSWYREQGYLPEAILNFIALLGWTHPDGKEIFDLKEFISLFDLTDIKAVAPIFDLAKLEWMNGEYIRKFQISNFKFQIYEYYKRKFPLDLIEKTIPLIQERIKKLSDYLPLCEFFFKRPDKYEIDLSGKNNLLEKIVEKLETITDWRGQLIGDQMQMLAEEQKIKTGDFFMILRVSITGKKISPPLNESMEILGKEETLIRLNSLIN